MAGKLDYSIMKLALVEKPIPGRKRVFVVFILHFIFDLLGSSFYTPMRVAISDHAPAEKGHGKVCSLFLHSIIN